MCGRGGDVAGENAVSYREPERGRFICPSFQPNGARRLKGGNQLSRSEGQVRTEAVVRHTEPGRGVGFKFTTVRDEDRSRLTVVITRLRSLTRDHAEL